MTNMLDVFEAELTKSGLSEKTRKSLYKIANALANEKYLVLESIGKSDEEITSIVEAALA